MTAVVGIDVSTRALDVVKLDESDNRAEWVRCELAGKDAWERTLGIRSNYSIRGTGGPVSPYFWEDVYLVAIEEPRGRGQLRTNALLNRVVGAVAASLPARLRCPERCWVVRPDEWKNGLGLKGKPTWADIKSFALDVTMTGDQNARDAYCLAYWAREKLAKACEEAV